MGNWGCSFAGLQKTENRKLRAENREQKAESRKLKAENRKPNRLSAFSSQFSVLGSPLSALRFQFSVLCFLFSVLCSLSIQAQQPSPFQVITPPSPIVIQAGETKSVSVHVEIPPKYFVYRDKTSFKFINLEGLEVEATQYPPSKKRRDIFFKKTLEVFEDLLPITVIFKAPVGLSAGKREVEGLLTFQGCSDLLCYPEETHLVTFSFDVGSRVVAGRPAPREDFSWGELLFSQDFGHLLKQSWWVVLAVVFLGGFLTALTPCVLPVIPVTLMIIGVRSDRHWSHNLILSVVLVLGLALMYAFLGLLAVSLGKGLGFVFQNQWFVLFLAVLFFILALSMFGLFEIRLPQRLAQRLNQIKGHGLWGAFVSGGAAGILAAPCAGPVIGALLLYVATTQSYAQGFGLLFLYALGMGLLFIVLGTGYGTLETKFKNWRLAVWIKKFLGLLLLLGSLFYLNTIFPMQKGIEALFKPSTPVEWLASEPQGLERAKAEQKPMLIDFYADWCAPCKELEVGFFRKKEMVALLKRMIPVRIDATFNDNPEVMQVLKKYNVIGWPTIVFVGPDGKILEELTVISYNPKLLLENMRKVVGDGK